MLKKFCQQIKPISISLSPNTEKEDIWLAFKLIFQFWKWKKGKAVEKLEEEFKNYLGVKYGFSFNSGRSCLMIILKALNLPSDTEVLVQAFTCNAAVNPVIWNNFKPVYVDCDEDAFNIDTEDLKKKISPKTRILIVQHTFGLPANMDEILKIVQDNNLILIEDCAHSLGAEIKGRKVGTFGKAAFFSFSRDKVISSVYGGMLATNDDNLAKSVKKEKYPCCCWIFQQLLHPVLMNWLILPTYRILGKYLLVLFQGLHILSKAVHWKEKIGKRPRYFPKKMPNSLAVLALNQFKKLEKFNNYREIIAQSYYQELKDSAFELPQRNNNIFLRFAIKHPRAHQIIKDGWKKNILIGDWYTSPVAPDDTKLEKVGYIKGTCPKAEKLAEITLNLPTHINISQAQTQKIINFLKNY